MNNRLRLANAQLDLEHTKARFKAYTERGKQLSAWICGKRIKEIEKLIEKLKEKTPNSGHDNS